MADEWTDPDVHDPDIRETASLDQVLNRQHEELRRGFEDRRAALESLERAKRILDEMGTAAGPESDGQLTKRLEDARTRRLHARERAEQARTRLVALLPSRRQHS